MQLFECVFNRWSPQIGDPTVMGWATVFAYGLTAILCFLAVSRSPNRTEKTFWLMLSAILAFLMINKQLDLQSALTAIGRCVAKIQGWYDDRKNVQILFIATILIVSVFLGGLLFKAMRRHLRFVWLAIIGSICLLAFVAIRAIGFHHFDAFIGFQIHNVRMNWVMELGGISLIALNAVWVFLFRIKSNRSPS